MPKSFIAALALTAFCLSSQAFAQSAEAPAADSGNGASPPALILPNTLTSPLISGSDADSHNSGPAPASGDASGAPSEQPYSVEGEETLDPDTN